MKKLFLLFLVFATVLSTACQRVTPLEPAVAPTDGELEAIALSLIPDAQAVYDGIMGLALDTMRNIDSEAMISENGIRYYKLIDMTAEDELWKMANAVYTEEASKRLFAPNIDGADGYTKKFIQRDGALYMAQAYHTVESSCYPLQSVKVSERKEGAFTVEADFYYTSAILHFKDTKNGWRLENSIAEGEREYTESIVANRQGIFGHSETLGELHLDTSGLIPSEALSFEEARAVFEPLFNRCTTVYHGYIIGGPLWSMGKADADITENGIEYCFVDYPELKSVSDVWRTAYGAYTYSAAQRIFAKRMTDAPRYIERDGKLYFDISSRGNHGIGYRMETLELIAQYENVLVFTLDEILFGEFETKRVFVLQKTEWGWRMANGFEEVVEVLQK